MREKTVVVMPGTIAMPPAGVLKQLAAEHLSVRDLLADVDRVGAEFDVPSLRDYLTDASVVIKPITPEVHYLALMAVSLAAFDAFLAEGGEPYAVFGQSIGEVWALVAAGGMSVADAARLACIRSRALSRHGWQGTMMGVGAGAVPVGHLVQAVDHPDLVVACLNSPRQTVVSGPRQEVAIVGRLADELGWATSVLPVPHPSHSPALASAGAAILAAAPKWSPGHLRWRLWSPTLQRWVTDMDDPVRNVIVGMTRPVHFSDVVRSLHAAGVETFVECSAEKILVKLIHASLPMVRVETPLANAASSTARGLGQVVQPKAPPAPDRIAVDPGQPEAAAVVAPELASTTKSVPENSAQPAEAVTVAGVAQMRMGRQEVLDELRKMYGDFLEYPPELLGEDDHLESDLGVESLKQVTLLVRVGKRFGLTQLQKDVRLLDYPTLGRIADMVVDAEGQAG